MKTLEVPDHLYDALELVVDTLTRKGQDYSDSDDDWSSNFATTAAHFGIPTWEAADFNEVQKLARLAALRRRGRGPLNEAVEDTYRDKACYALLAYALLLHDTARAPTDTASVRISGPVSIQGGGGGMGSLAGEGATGTPGR